MTSGDRPTLSGPPPVVVVPPLPPPASLARPRSSAWPARAATWAPLLVALVGAGGVPTACEALRGTSQRRATEALTSEVQRLSGQVERLGADQRATAERLTELRATVEAREQARREQTQLARSHLTQPPAPDVQGALRALDTP